MVLAFFWLALVVSKKLEEEADIETHKQVYKKILLVVCILVGVQLMVEVADKKILVACFLVEAQLMAELADMK